MTVWPGDDYEHIHDDDGDVTSEEDLCEKCLHRRGDHVSDRAGGHAGGFCKVCKRKCKFKESA